MIALKLIHRDGVELKLEFRANQIKSFQKFAKIYMQVARSWLRKSIKKPLLAML